MNSIAQALVALILAAGPTVAISTDVGECTPTAEAHKFIASKLTAEQARTLHPIVTLTDPKASCSTWFVYVRDGRNIEVSFFSDFIHGMKFSSSNNGRTARLLIGLPYNDFTLLQLERSGASAAFDIHVSNSRGGDSRVNVVLKVEHSDGDYLPDNFLALLKHLGTSPWPNPAKPPESRSSIKLNVTLSDEKANTVLLAQDVSLQDGWIDNSNDAEIVVDELSLRPGDHAARVEVLSDNPDLAGPFETGVLARIFNN